MPPFAKRIFHGCRIAAHAGNKAHARDDNARFFHKSIGGTAHVKQTLLLEAMLTRGLLGFLCPLQNCNDLFTMFHGN